MIGSSGHWVIGKQNNGQTEAFTTDRGEIRGTTPLKRKERLSGASWLCFLSLR
jgi:hypothetical protein